MIDRSSRIPFSGAAPIGDSFDSATGPVASVHPGGVVARAAMQLGPGTEALLGAVLSDGAARFARRLETAPTRRSPPPRATAGKPTAVALLERSIRNHPAFRKLSPGDQQVANWIMWRASQGAPEKRLYYLDKLATPFATRYSPPSTNGAKELARWLNELIDADLARERARGDVFKGQEELASAAARMTSRRGRGGVLYRVDARDPKNVVVKLKVRLRGAPELVAKIKALEDAIEKRASTRGYTLDLEFVSRRGPDVYDVEVDDRQWPTVANWAGPAECVAHELHHVLGLADRYDYIDSHAANPHMPVNARLYYFVVQMGRAPDPRGASSLMGSHDGTLLSEDVCAVAQGSQQECIDGRKHLDPPGL